MNFIRKSKKYDKKYYLIAGDSYGENVKGKPLASIRDTGNGYIVKFKSFNSIQQDTYVCLEYHQAEDLLHMLVHLAHIEDNTND